MKEYNFDKQHNKGKLHAYERINMLLDEGSFHEIGADIMNIATDFGIDKNTLPYDGVITGYGTINGKGVCIYSQDFTIVGGTLGNMHGKKIADIISRAIDYECPIIGINDSGGARVQEGVASLAAYGDIFFNNTLASGFIPQISIIAGPCAGGAVYSPGITDFIFTIDGISNMFVTGPKVIKQVTNELVTAEELGGSMIHSFQSGVSHFRCSSEVECFNRVKALLDIIPQCCNENKIKKSIYIEKNDPKLEKIIPLQSNKTYNVKEVIDCIIDDSFIEIQEEFAKNIVIGLAKLSGITIGVVANQPNYMAGVLDCDSSDKAARFIRYCDCYDIPVITFTDVPGFFPGVQQEYKGIIRHGAKLLYAYSEATTIKLTIIMRKAYGGAYIAMGSKHLQADFVYAWPKAEMAVMGCDAAVELIYSKSLSDMEPEERKKFIVAKKNEYNTLYMNASIGLNNGYVDAQIEPSQTRKRLYEDIIFLQNKQRKHRINKKHGNIPL